MKFDQQLEAKYRALIDEYAKALKWTREKLQSSECECRRLRYIIIELTEDKTEQEEADAVFDP